MTDLYIVLGCGILESKRRAKFAAEMVARTPEIPLILTGGMPKIIPLIQHPKMTEARYMEKVFTKRNFSNPIYLEESATTTAQNLLYSRILIESTPALRSTKDITLINGSAHLPRTQWLSRILLRNYNVTEIPVPILGNGSSIPEVLHGITLEAISYMLESQTMRKNKHAFAEWVSEGESPENFPGITMTYNNI